MSLMVFCRRFHLISKQISHFRLRSGGPSEPILSTVETEVPQNRISVDQETIIHLERLSLVDFANKRGIERLEEAIKFADKINVVDTTDVDPLVTVLENEVLSLREDEVTEENDIRLVLSTASQTEEDYYVAPPGNIPLTSRDLNDLK